MDSLLQPTQRHRFAWKQLDPEWQKKLLSRNFVEKDCLGDGNCQFRSVETALRDAGIKTTHLKLRKAIASHIKEMPATAFNEMLLNYRAEKQSGEFRGTWDPDAIRTKREFIKAIKTPGFHFTGDHSTLALLSRIINVDFVILDNAYTLTDLSNPDQLHDYVILLYYMQGNPGHFKTVGLRDSNNNKVTTLFRRAEMPMELDRILDKHTLLLQHIVDYVSKNTRVTLNEVMHYLEETLHTTFSRSDNRRVMTILRNVLENQNFLG